ncbi:MAG: 3-methyl-2-oxobutanoate hydroxymethyltransferase [Bacillota bacterium]|nr:3-methyl-2-oxobutanoate hydroxymethyltransferase [Bacillota bacterium]
MQKFTISDFKKRKHNGEKITMVTAYDYSTAKLVEEAEIDTILIGDSLGMTMLGYEDTLPVTVDEMIHHAKAVRRGAKLPFLVVDMPFLSYHINAEEAVRNAGRMIKETGANAVKLEGGADVAEQIKAILRAQIPVMGHIGLTPQSIHALGGFKVQGKSEEAARRLLDEALLLQELGCFSIVLEAVPDQLAALISSRLSIPTIGIGAGSGCDGQVLVIQDMLGMFSDFTPKFVKKYADLKGQIVGALQEYSREVRSGDFPAKEHSFHIADEIIDKLY